MDYAECIYSCMSFKVQLLIPHLLHIHQSPYQETTTKITCKPFSVNKENNIVLGKEKIDR
jgi:hypothetical protein